MLSSNHGMPVLLKKSGQFIMETDKSSGVLLRVGLIKHRAQRIEWGN